MKRLRIILKQWSWREWMLVGIFAFTLPLVNPHLRSDGNEYYAYVCSLVIDGDLHFENQYRHGDPLFQGTVFDARGQIRESSVVGDGSLGRLPNGYVQNYATVGPSLLWLPFFLVAHAWVHLLNVFGVQIAADGFSAPYRWLCAWGTALYGFIGLFLSYRIACRICPPTFAFLATIGIWFASPLPVYLYFLPFHVPALASFAATLFLWYWLRTRTDRTARQWAIWGALGGLMMEVYNFGTFFLLIALWEGGKAIQRDRRAIIKGLFFIGGAFLVMIPQFWIKWILTGSPFKSGYGEPFYWTSPRLLELGFSPEHGMFLWTPILIFAVLGLIWLWRRDRELAGGMLVVYGAAYYVMACYQHWHGISSFGSRFFVAFTPAFILGLGVFLEQSAARLETLRPRLSKTVLRVGLGLFMAWNIGFIFQWGTNLVPHRGPVDFARMAQNQVTVVPGKMASFALRYFQHRETVTHEMEEQDLKNMNEFQLQR